MRLAAALLAVVATCRSESVALAGLEQPVEILRDRWGVPHIYARTSADLFFAQGWMAARDRLFQIDLWRRAGNGTLAEVLGPSAVGRDRIARLIRFRGDWNVEWSSYAPDTRAVATAFVSGVNAYIRSLNGRRTAEFERAGYDPGLWVPEDCLNRLPTLIMTRNLSLEVAHAQEAQYFGLRTLEKLLRLEPPIPLQIPPGLDTGDISTDILSDVARATAEVRIDTEGSNNWVVDGTMTASGKPLLASDPHRPVRIPSLRKTVHLAGGGWNAIGAGEPGLPGIALGHNEHIGFGFTIVGIDQQDLYVEKLNPSNPDEYLSKGVWRKVEIERQQLRVKGEQPRTIELRFTTHGPVIHEDRRRNRAFALRWVGSEPGTAGYLGALAVARARDWKEFLAAMARYRAPSENMLYADTAGNIGWQVGGLAPVRKNWSGLFPVPGDAGAYEWSGFLAPEELPRAFNPASHWIATANHNILPPGYKHALQYEWAQPFRYQRIQQLLPGRTKLTVADFERMQHDVVSVAARRLQAILRKWTAPPGRAREVVARILAWDAKMESDSPAALIYAVWSARLPLALYGEREGSRVDLATALARLERELDPDALETSLEGALEDVTRTFGPDMSKWKWGNVHQLNLRHPLNQRAWDRGPVTRSGDAHTVNSTGGARFRQSTGASFRMVLDLADWDRSTMTNVPGESGDPSSPHYSDLLDGWAAGRYHPMPFSRPAVEAATIEHIHLIPKK